MPGKNIKQLNGKPLLQYSIETAKATPAIGGIFVSTDCSEIASVAIENGVEVIKRPAYLATDDAPEWLAWRHAVDYVSEKYGSFDCFVSLPATSPLRTPLDVTSAIKIFANSDVDICISITPASRSPYFNMVKTDLDGNLSLGAIEDAVISRRQDAPAMYDITTVVYVTSPSFVNLKSSIFEGKVKGVIVPKERAVDIDDIYDFMLAEAIVKEVKRDVR